MGTLPILHFTAIGETYLNTNKLNVKLSESNHAHGPLGKSLYIIPTRVEIMQTIRYSLATHFLPYNPLESHRIEPKERNI